MSFKTANRKSSVYAIHVFLPSHTTELLDLQRGGMQNITSFEGRVSDSHNPQKATVD